MRERIHDFESRDAQLLTVVPNGPGNNIDKFIAKNGDYPFPMLLDERHAVFDRYDVAKKLLSLGQRPALFVIDRDGVIRYNQVGTQQTNIPPIDETLGELDKLA